MLRPVQPPERRPIDEEDEELSFEEACALKALADRGAADGFVRAPDVGPSRLRKMRERGLVDLAEGAKGMEKRLTAKGAALLARALKIIAAGPARGAR